MLVELYKIHLLLGLNPYVRIAFEQTSVRWENYGHNGSAGAPTSTFQGPAIRMFEPVTRIVGHISKFTVQPTSFISLHGSPMVKSTA